MSWFTDIVKKFEGIFHSPTAQAIEKTVETLVPLAKPIVDEIASMTPNRTVQEIAKAYNLYGLPFVQTIMDSPNGAALALQNLAVQVLQKNHVPNAAISLIQTAVQLAYLALKSQAPAAASPQVATTPAASPVPPSVDVVPAAVNPKAQTVTKS